jgi:hypothetical protein
LKRKRRQRLLEVKVIISLINSTISDSEMKEQAGDDEDMEDEE